MDGVSELNKRKVRLFVQAVWNEGRLELIDELVGADYTGHFSPPLAEAVGREGLRRLIVSRREACPGLHIVITDQIAEDDRVVTRWQVAAAMPDGQGSAEMTADTRSAGLIACTPCGSGISIVRLLAGKQVDSLTECTIVGGRSERTTSVP